MRRLLPDPAESIDVEEAYAEMRRLTGREPDLPQYGVDLETPRQPGPYPVKRFQVIGFSLQGFPMFVQAVSELVLREQVPDVPMLVGRDIFIDFDLTALIGRHRFAIFIHNAVARLGGDAFAGCDDAGQVQRICGTDGNQLFIILLLAHRAQQADRFR